MEKLIPIMLCFNDNYSIPGMVAIKTLLASASKIYSYNIHILHSNITAKNKKRMHRIVERFPNAHLFFHNMENRFEDTFEKVENQAYWSREIFYKCITSSFFPQYDRIVISDVDVIFCRDFTPHWELFLKDNDSFLAGYTCLIKKKIDSQNEERKESCMDEDENRWHVLTGAGFWFQNLKLMRQENIEAKIYEFIQKHVKKLRQPEQEVVNVVCYPRIMLLPPEGMILAWDYQNYKIDDDFHQDKRYPADTVKWALSHPIQLHYAGGLKPWNAVFVSKSSLWWKELLKLGELGIALEQIWKSFWGHGYFAVLRNSFRNILPNSCFLRWFYRIYKVCLGRHRD